MVIGGGVACNSRLREVLYDMCDRKNIEIYFPSPNLCMDNGAMIAMVAYKNKDRATFDYNSIDAEPHLNL